MGVTCEAPAVASATWSPVAAHPAPSAPARVAAIGPEPIGPPVIIPPGTNGSIVGDVDYVRAPNMPKECPRTVSIDGPLPTAYDANGTTMLLRPSDFHFNGEACTGTKDTTVLVTRFGKDLADATLELQNLLDVQWLQKKYPGAVLAWDRYGSLKDCGGLKWGFWGFRFMLWVERNGVFEMHFSADVPHGYCVLTTRW
ncbi:hypothetical protein I4F81_006743 [Pyropia yezoensis]|uniref:Uncharacterized protein n=1 Tax=Pyropia yezoensis TaxID=2788 RepID=A0ACC3C2V3_PYRYE|nr:hypothetical protein I4F81_006743 [Neopyropia yezoensis]